MAIVPQTEAACLLESGAMYPRRVLLRRQQDDPILGAQKNAGFSLYFGDAPILHFDLDGRWQRAFLEGIHYLKGLETTVQAIDRVREGESLVLKRRTLDFAETVDLDEKIRALVLDLEKTLAEEMVDVVTPKLGENFLPLDDLCELLDRATRWNCAAWFAHRERFAAAYGDLPFLPADCPNPIVLQATRRDFESHAKEVARLLGRRADSSKLLYLVGSEPHQLVAEELLERLDVAGKIFGLKCFHLYIDSFGPGLPDAAGWHTLRMLGLQRIHLGVDPYQEQTGGLQSLVADLKTAAIGVSVIVPVGVNEQGLGRTLSLIDTFPLGPGDLVSFLGAADLSPMKAATSVPAACPDIELRLDLLKPNLARLQSRKVKIAPFRLEKQGL